MQKKGSALPMTRGANSNRANKDNNNRVKRERLKTFYSQNLLGQVLGTDGRTIYRIESNQKKLNTSKSRDVIRLAHVLKRGQGRYSQLSMRCLFDNEFIRTSLTELDEKLKENELNEKSKDET